MPLSRAVVLFCTPTHSAVRVQSPTLVQAAHLPPPPCSLITAVLIPQVLACTSVRISDAGRLSCAFGPFAQCLWRNVY